jgi:hypothetical protein
MDQEKATEDSPRHVSVSEFIIEYFLWVEMKISAFHCVNINFYRKN